MPRIYPNISNDIISVKQISFLTYIQDMVRDGRITLLLNDNNWDDIADLNNRGFIIGRLSIREKNGFYCGLGQKGINYLKDHNINRI